MTKQPIRSILIILLCLPMWAIAGPLEEAPSWLSIQYANIYNTYRSLFGKRPVRLHHLPPCFVDLKGLNSEWGERQVAAQWTKGYCTSVLEFGGRSGSVSAVIQMNLENRKNHVVIQPDERAMMFGGLAKLRKNKESCKMEFTEIDHILRPGEGSELLKLVSKPFDCIVADCEDCLGGEYDKNPILFENVRYIQVERDDRNPLDAKEGQYDKLREKLKMKKLHSGLGCGGACETEVWGK